MRPRTRGDCIDGPRPCPWLSCRGHLALDVSVHTGRILPIEGNRYSTDDEIIALVEGMTDTCALDVADRELGQGLTLEEVGALLNITRERVRQIEDKALFNMHLKILQSQDLHEIT